MNYLPTCAEFRAIRDELALKAMNERLPVLEAQIDALWIEIAPILKDMRDNRNKSAHIREKIYAALEGRDVLYWQLCFERDAIVNRTQTYAQNEVTE